MKFRLTDVRVLAMGLAFAAFWGSAFSSARIIVQDAPPLTTLSVRFFISGLIALAIAWRSGRLHPVPLFRWRAIAIFGICQNGLYLGLVFVAVQVVEASIAAIIASTMPLIVALASIVLFNQKLERKGIVGILVGFLGVSLVLASRITGQATLWGLLLCIISVLSLSVATMTIRSLDVSRNMFQVIGLQMLVGSAVLFPFGLTLEPLHVSWSVPLILAFTYTTLVPGLLATWIWFALVERAGATRAATFHFLHPFFGVVTAAVLLGESLSLLDVVGVVTIMAGILAVVTSRPARHAPG